MKKIVKSRLVAVSKTRVLVLKKVGKPLRYTLPGGVKKKKESREEALLREVAEEIDLSLCQEQIQWFLSRIEKGDTKWISKHYFWVPLPPEEIAIKEKHKFENACWMNWKLALSFMDKSDKTAIKACFKNFQKKENEQKKTYQVFFPPLP